MQLCRFAAICAISFGAFSEAVAANVVLGPFEVVATGDSHLQNDQWSISANNIVSQSPNHGFTAISASLTISPVLSGNAFAGNLILSSNDGEIFADVSGQVFGLETLFSSAAGEFLITGGTGIFSDMAGNGVFNVMMNNETGSTQVKIAGMLIPGPGTLAVIACAALFGPRRRRSPS